jgi:hypothetical protein
MTNIPNWLVVVLVVAVIVLLSMVSGRSLMQPGSHATTAWKIQNAMSAAPYAISKEATIMDWPAAEGTQPTQLRAGNNGWVCYPDVADTPTNDPMCLDKVWQAWADAWLGKKPFSTAVPGIAYMLQGASDASNTDPFKTAPDPGEQWVISPPHLMLIVPDPAAIANLPTDPHNGGPWVMFKGTPYQHVMIPVGK